MAEPQAVGGLYETGIGVPDLDTATEYWGSFGFRAGPEASLDAAVAEGLYGHSSALTSRRLLHQDADHGLIRLMCWEFPINDGVGLKPLRGHISRWTGQFVRSAADVSNHARIAETNGLPINDLPPTFIDLSTYNPGLFDGKAPRPFLDPVIGVSEYSLIQPLSRQAFLERFNYESKMLGTYNDDCLFPATQIAHIGLMFTSDDHGVYDFYDQTLGLKRVSDAPIPYEKATASRDAYDLVESDTYWAVNFEEPGSGTGMDERRSGRLLMFRFESGSNLEDLSELARPGCLGHSLNTWRIRDLNAFHDECGAAGCTNLTSIQPDEFGVEAFTCKTPDEFIWTFIQA